jgi:hypothetical protein
MNCLTMRNVPTITTPGRHADRRRYCLAHAQCPVMAIPPPALACELAHGRLGRVF